MLAHSEIVLDEAALDRSEKRQIDEIVRILTRHRLDAEADFINHHGVDGLTRVAEDFLGKALMDQHTTFIGEKDKGASHCLALASFVAQAAASPQSRAKDPAKWREAARELRTKLPDDYAQTAAKSVGLATPPNAADSQPGAKEPVPCRQAAKEVGTKLPDDHIPAATKPITLAVGSNVAGASAGARRRDHLRLL